MRWIAALVVLGFMGVLAWAGDEPATKPELTSLGYNDEVATLSPDTTHLQVSYRKGSFAELVRQCPDLVELVIEEHGDLSPEDLRALTGLERLRSLKVFGDLSISSDDLEALGSLTQLRALNLAPN